MAGGIQVPGKERFAPLFGAMLNKAYLGMQREYSAQLLRGDIGRVDEHEGESAEQSKYNEGKVFIIHRHDLSINKHRPDIWRADAITYVPVSHERLIERGFNQAERMAVELSRYQGLPVIPLLQRTSIQRSRASRVEEKEKSRYSMLLTCVRTRNESSIF